MIVSAIGLGILCSLLFTELTGLVAGGLISAGYMAFFIHQPARIGVTLGVALLVHGLLQVVSRLFILYGRRRFAAAIIGGYGLGWLCTVVLSSVMTADVDVRAVGFIVPGLIANDMARQGVKATLLALASATVLTRLMLELAIALGWL